MSVFVIDISNWQGDVNTSNWLAMNIHGGIAKALEGMTGIDKKWFANKRKLEALQGSNFVPGAYHYINNIHPAGDQCKAFLDLVPGDWMHHVDVEAPGPLDPDGWFREYRKHYPDKIVGIYTNEPMWRNRSKVSVTDAAKRYAPCVIWVAGAYKGAYQGGTDDFRKIWSRVPAGADGGLPQLGFTEYALMQYTGSATVPGISGPCDMSVAGSIDILKQLAASHGGTVDMPLTDAEWTKLRAIVDDVVHDRLANPWVNADALSPDSKTQVSPLQMIVNSYTQTRAALAALGATEAQIKALVADDPNLNQITEVLNAKLGSGQGGLLSKQDVLDAVTEVVGQTTFVPQKNTP
jgi:GH25 family lysozyme M1 (1,4-beta-N-acetylmuramidase)